MVFSRSYWDVFIHTTSRTCRTVVLSGAFFPRIMCYHHARHPLKICSNLPELKAEFGELGGVQRPLTSRVRRTREERRRGAISRTPPSSPNSWGPSSRAPLPRSPPSSPISEGTLGGGRASGPPASSPNSRVPGHRRRHGTAEFERGTRTRTSPCSQWQDMPREFGGHRRTREPGGGVAPPSSRAVAELNSVRVLSVAGLAGWQWQAARVRPAVPNSGCLILLLSTWILQLEIELSERSLTTDN